MPGASKLRRQNIIEALSNANLIVRNLPIVSDLVFDRVTVNSTKEVDFDGLLDRNISLPTGTY